MPNDLEQMFTAGNADFAPNGGVPWYQDPRQILHALGKAGLPMAGAASSAGALGPALFSRLAQSQAMGQGMDQIARSPAVQQTMRGLLPAQIGGAMGAGGQGGMGMGRPSPQMPSPMQSGMGGGAPAPGLPQGGQSPQMPPQAPQGLMPGEQGGMPNQGMGGSGQSSGLQQLIQMLIAKKMREQGQGINFPQATSGSPMGMALGVQ